MKRFLIALLILLVIPVVSSAAEYNADDYSEYLKQVDTSSFTDVLSMDTR